MRHGIVGSVFAAALLAAVGLPFCSPARADDVMVNGLPCNALCRLWMGVKLPGEPNANARKTAPRVAAEDGSEPSIKRHASKPAARRIAVARANPPASRQLAGDRQEKAGPEAAGVATLNTPPLVREAPSTLPPASNPPDAKTEAEPTLQPSAATAAAPSPTASPTTKVSSEWTANEEPQGEPVASESGPTMSETAAKPADPPPAQVLIVLAKPEVKSVADLRDKSILLAGAASIPKEQLKASFAAAGASGTEFKQGDNGDIEQVGAGEVAAAVIAVFSPETAATFHDIPGYQVLRVEVPTRTNP